MLDQASGRDLFLQSTAPLRTPDEAGRKRPVDLRLERRGEGFTPANPVGETTIPADLRRGIALKEAGIRLRPEAVAESEPAVVGDQQVFFPNVATDTDFAASPTRAGIETFAHLRSERSPEEHALVFDLPAGARLERAGRGPGPGGGAEILRGDERLAFVSPPVAWDADGELVPVSYAVRGERFEMKVAHRAGDYRYPIVLDPIVSQFNFVHGWHPVSEGNTYGFYHQEQYYGFNHYVGTSYWGNGFYLWSDNGAYLPYDAWDEWVWAAWPHTTIAYAIWSDIQFHPADTCLRVYIWSFERGAEPPDYIRECSYNVTNGWWWACPDWSCTDRNVPGQTYAVFNLQSPVAYVRGDGSQAFFGEAQMALADFVRPWFQHGGGAPPLTHHDLPAGWTRSAAIQAEIHMRDWGLGAKRVSVSHPDRSGGTREESLSHGCDGTWHASCPEWYARHVPYHTDSMPEGINSVRAHGYDVVNNRVDSDTWQVRVDRTPPKVLGYPGPVRDGSKVTGGLHQFRVDAEDVGGGGAQNSGVKQIELWVDGARRQTASPNCGHGSCSHTFTLDTTEATYAENPAQGFSEGSHRIKAIAVDEVGQRSSAEPEITITVDRTPPDADAYGSLRPEDEQGPWVAAGPQRLTVEAEDAASGVDRAELLIDNTLTGTARPPCPGCSLDHDFDVDTTSYPEGDHTVTYKVFDQVGLVTEESWPIKLERRAPTMTVTGSLKAAAGQTLVGPSYDLTVVAEDTEPIKPQSGMGSINIEVDGNHADFVEQPCALGNCPLVRQFTFHPAQYPPGQHEITVRGRDLGQNVVEESWTVTVPEQPPEPCPATPLSSLYSSTGQVITVDEALTTLRAWARSAGAEVPMGSGSEARIIAPSQPTTLDGRTLQPGLTAGELSFPASGIIFGTSVERRAASGLSTTTHTTPICLTPASVTAAASDAKLVNDTAALYANVAPSVDSVVRPTAVGAEVFQQLRDATAPAQLSWNVGLAPGQSLERLDATTVAIVDTENASSEPASPEQPPPAAPPTSADHEQGVTDTAKQLQVASDELDRAQAQTSSHVEAVISARWAKDANGASIPVALSTAGTTVTLTLDLGSNPAFPVVADPQLFSASAVDEADTLRIVQNSPPVTLQEQETALGESLPAPEPDLPDDGTARDTGNARPAPIGAGQPPTSPGDYSDPEAPSQYEFSSANDPDNSSASGDAPEAPSNDADPSATEAKSSLNQRLSRLRFGISDSDDDTFVTPAGAFDELRASGPGPAGESPKGLTRARAILPWNFVDFHTDPNSGTDEQKAQGRFYRNFENWINRVPEGVAVLVSFERTGFGPAGAPRTVGIYRRKVEQFLTTGKWLKVRYVGAWNEPNYIRRARARSERDPLATTPDGAQTAARFWMVVNHLCTTLKRNDAGDINPATTGDNRCAAVAGEFAGYRGARYRLGDLYFDHYFDALCNRRRCNKRDIPIVWGMHAHTDVNHAQAGISRSPQAVRVLVDRLRGKFAQARVWVTEIGAHFRQERVNIDEKVRGRVCSGDRVQKIYDNRLKNHVDACIWGMRNQALATDFIFKRIPMLSTRISQIYYFNFHHTRPFRCSNKPTYGGGPPPKTLQCSVNDRTLIGNDDDRPSQAPGADSVPGQRRDSFCVVRKRSKRESGRCIRRR